MEFVNNYSKLRNKLYNIDLNMCEFKKIKKYINNY